MLKKKTKENGCLQQYFASIMPLILFHTITTYDAPEKKSLLKAV